MMNKLFTLLLAASCFTATAQSDIDYPYNPDFENDGFVGIEDVLELLSVYGTPFTPEQLLLDGSSLTEIIESLQSQIDSLASYTNEGFGAIALNDSLLTEYLVSVAAASEEGDSTLGAWVMQLSEVVEQQQAQIDSLSTVNLGLAFGATEHAKFHELEWTQQENAGNTLQTILSFENDVLFRLYGGNSWIKFVIIPNSVTLDLVANANLAEANFSESFWEGENPTITLALNSDEMLVMFANSGAIEAETTTGEMNVFWTPLVQNSNEADGPTENNEDNLGPCQGEFTINYHGYEYELVEIGDQCWFAENLRSFMFTNGDEIPAGIDFPAEIPGVVAGCNSNCGNVYNKAAVIDGRGLCPAGWSIPVVLDWSELLARTTGVGLSIEQGVTGFKMRYGGANCEGNDCGTYNPDGTWHPNVQLWSTYGGTNFHTSTPDEGDVLVNIGFEEGDVNTDYSPESWSFGAIGDHIGLYARCIKD